MSTEIFFKYKFISTKKTITLVSRRLFVFYSILLQNNFAIMLCDEMYDELLRERKKLFSLKDEIIRKTSA